MLPPLQYFCEQLLDLFFRGFHADKTALQPIVSSDDIGFLLFPTDNAYIVKDVQIQWAV